ncbi:hypothetical protein MXD81_25905, partial [Microbacteriaceae bacterium K1510]|nr:hypothetical protein [Microbacteriaceae bacterium K1510]
LDKQKVGVIKHLDNKATGKVHTFLDDLVASIAANASSRMAHRLRDEQEAEEAQQTIQIVEDTSEQAG